MQLGVQLDIPASDVPPDDELVELLLEAPDDDVAPEVVPLVPLEAPLVVPLDAPDPDDEVPEPVPPELPLDAELPLEEFVCCPLDVPPELAPDPPDPLEVPPSPFSADDWLGVDEQPAARGQAAAVRARMHMRMWAASRSIVVR